MTFYGFAIVQRRFESLTRTNRYTNMSSVKKSLSSEKFYHDLEKSFEPLDIYTAASLGDVAFFTKFDVRELAFKLSVPNLSGWTPLMYACSKGHSTLVNYLLMSGAKKDNKTKSGVTPLMLAISSGDLTTVESIFDQSSLEEKDYRNWTALFYAVHFTREKCIKFLLSKGAEVNIVDYQNETPLMAAIKLGRETMVELLIKKVRDLDVVSFKQESAIMLANESNNSKIQELVQNHVEFLKNGGNQENFQTYMNVTPKHFQCKPMTSQLHFSPTPLKQQLKSQLSSMRLGKSLTYSPSKVMKSSMEKSKMEKKLTFALKEAFPKKFWSPQLRKYNDVEQFLKNLGLEKYWPIFRDEEVDFEILLTLNEENLKELGITAFGPRKKITLAIQQLRHLY